MTFGIFSSKHHDVIFSGTKGEPVSGIKDSSLYFCLLCVSSYPRRPSGGLKGHVEVSRLILQREKRCVRVASLAPGHLSFYRQNIESHLVFSQPSVKNEITIWHVSNLDGIKLRAPITRLAPFLPKLNNKNKQRKKKKGVLSKRACQKRIWKFFRNKDWAAC